MCDVCTDHHARLIVGGGLAAIGRSTLAKGLLRHPPMRQHQICLKSGVQIRKPSRMSFGKAYNDRAKAIRLGLIDRRKGYGDGLEHARVQQPPLQFGDILRLVGIARSPRDKRLHPSRAGSPRRGQYDGAESGDRPGGKSQIDLNRPIRVIDRYFTRRSRRIGVAKRL